jgi:hypothetical protein
MTAMVDSKHRVKPSGRGGLLAESGKLAMLERRGCAGCAARIWRGGRLRALSSAPLRSTPGHWVRLSRRLPAGRRLDTLLARAKSHSSGRLALKASRVGAFDVGKRSPPSQQAQLIAQARGLLEVKGCRRRLHPSPDPFNLVRHRDDNGRDSRLAYAAANVGG